MKDIENQAKKIHEQWLEQNRDYVDKCRREPVSFGQSHDFDRSVEWGQLPEFWKKEYIRIARYRALTGCAARTE